MERTNVPHSFKPRSWFGYGDNATPIVFNPPNWGIFDGSISIGAIRMRLAWAKRRETNRRYINTAKKQFMLVDH
jgi:hypothetical protein